MIAYMLTMNCFKFHLNTPGNTGNTHREIHVKQAGQDCDSYDFYEKNEKETLKNICQITLKK